jgi:hypothetical protein
MEYEDHYIGMLGNNTEDYNGLFKLVKEFLLLTTSELDEYTSEKGDIKVEGSQITLFTPAHIQYARYGRGPGKRPPFEVILDFVKKNGILFDNTDEKGTAFAIQASIGKNGTIGYTKNAPNFLEETLNKNFVQYQDKLSGALKVIVQEQVNQIVTVVKFKSEYKI